MSFQWTSCAGKPWEIKLLMNEALVDIDCRFSHASVGYKNPFRKPRKPRVSPALEGCFDGDLIKIQSNWFPESKASVTVNCAVNSVRLSTTQFDASTFPSIPERRHQFDMKSDGKTVFTFPSKFNPICQTKNCNEIERHVLMQVEVQGYIVRHQQ